jgi:hypothetical protein
MRERCRSSLEISDLISRCHNFKSLQEDYVVYWHHTRADETPNTEEVFSYEEVERKGS